MPSSARNFSRPYRPNSLVEESVEQPPSTKSSAAIQPPPTRNVLRKKPPLKRSARIHISAPTDVQTIQEGHAPLTSSEEPSFRRGSVSKAIVTIQARRESHQQSGHPMPLASHPHTMSFVQAPSEVSLPDLSAIPCLNAYSNIHGLECSHVVRAPTYEACGKNCESFSGQGLLRETVKEAFTCQACIVNLLDAKCKQKQQLLTDRRRHLWPF